MIQTDNSDTLEGNAPIQNFTVELNSTMFDMLTTKVYTDVIAAPIRELSTNAVDACIQANLPIKFHTHLPTLLESHFSVRDYGLGLSNEDVLGLYSTLGASTKRNSNELNGTFGIGRTSCLAYAEAFTVTSFFNGVKIAYLVTTNMGIPSMIPLGETPTDEENGLLVSFEVQRKDADTFTEKAREIYKYFDVRPTTNVELSIKEPIKTIEGKDWYLEEMKRYSYNNHTKVIMGGVVYDVSRNIVEVSNTLLNSPLRFEVPLGAVSITPGRESLNMDEKTIAYLVKRFKDVRVDATSALIKTLDKYKTPWEKACGFNEAYSASPSGLIDATAYKNLPKSISNTQEGLRLNPTKDSRFNVKLYERDRVTGKPLEGQTPRVTKKVHFLIADQRVHIKDAVASYRASLGAEVAVITIQMDKYDKSLKEEQIASMKFLLKDFGSPTYELVSTWAPLLSKTTVKGQVITAKDFTPLVFSVTNTSATAYRGSLLSQYKGISKFYYVEMSGHEVLNLPIAKLSAYLRFEKLYNEQHTKTFRVVGVPKGGMKNIAKDSRFEPIENMKELHGQVKFYDKQESGLYNETFRRLRESLLKKFIDGCPKDLKQTFEALEIFSNEHPYRTYDVCTWGINELIKCEVIKPKCKLTMEEIHKKYVLLKVLLTGYGSVTVAQLLHYINLEGK